VDRGIVPFAKISYTAESGSELKSPQTKSDISEGSVYATRGYKRQRLIGRGRNVTRAVYRFRKDLPLDVLFAISPDTREPNPTCTWPAII
jgi:hypothetical protein